MYWDSDRKKRKEFDAVLAEQKAKEKNEAWIRELEARDEEEKAFRAARERRRHAAMADTAEKRGGGDAGFGVAKTMIDEREGRRRRGVVEMVEELLLNSKK